MFLSKDTLLNTYYRFVNIELTANDTITHPTPSLSNACFLRKAHRHLLALGNGAHHFSALLVAIVNSKVTNKKHNMESVNNEDWPCIPKGMLTANYKTYKAELRQSIRAGTSYIIDRHGTK